MFEFHPTSTLNEPRAPLSVLLCADRRVAQRLGPMIRRLAIGLLDQAVEVRLLADGDHFEEMATGSLEVIRHHASPWPFARIEQRRVLDALAERSPAVIHALSPTIGTLAQRIADDLDAELVVQLCTEDDCRMAASGRLSAGAWIAGSTRLRDLAQQQYGLSPDHVEMIRPGVLVSSTIACFADDDQEPTILCTAPLMRGAGVDRLLGAMDILRSNQTTVLLFLVAEGPLEGEFRQYVKRRGLSEQVTFARPIGEAADAMSGADIFVHTETDRAISMDVLQAMGRGLAVVSHPEIGCDSIQAGKTAFVCETPTKEGMAAVLQTILQDRETARAMAQRGLEHVRVHHTVSGMAEHVTRLYHRLVNQHTTIRLKE